MSKLPGLAIRRDIEADAGNEVPDTGITQAWLLFEDVFVPNERVFMCREYKYTGRVIQYFTANCRACIGACVMGQGDVMIGSAILMARANGLSAKTFMSKLVDMSVNNTVTHGLGVGACALGFEHSSGAYFADSHTAHTNKVIVSILPYEIKRLTQDIGGGVPGCMHGGGSLDGAKLVGKATIPMEEYIGHARKIMKIEEEIPDPETQKRKETVVAFQSNF